MKKFWEKASGLKYNEFTEIVNKILDETGNKESRVRAAAITALASLASGVSWEMPTEVMDRALIMTGDGSKEVKDAAADASDQDGTGYGISLAVNENLSVSYGRHDVDFGGTGKEDEESSGISASARIFLATDIVRS